MTRQDVSIETRFSLSAIQSWERGWRDPSANAVANLARLYGVSMESLFVHAPDATEAERDPGNNQPPNPAKLASLAAGPGA